MVYSADQIRNIAILGHQGSGKTSLVESLAYVAGVIKEKGEITKKNTLSDYLSDEQKRGSSIQTSVISLIKSDHKINILDLPGSDDFIGEALATTSVVKGAVLVVDATTGVQVTTLKHYKLLKQAGIPCFMFVNKMDRENVNFDEVLAGIKDKIGKTAVPFDYPIGKEASFNGYVNIVEKKAYKYEGKTAVEIPIPEELKDKVEELYTIVIESVASTSDELLEKYSCGEEITNDEIQDALKKAIINDELIPVLVGSALKDVGIAYMLKMFVDFLPSPSELKPMKGVDEAGNEVLRKTTNDEPFSAVVFKTYVDPYAGVINLFKITSGSLKVGDEILIDGVPTKVSTLFTMLGKNLNPVDELGAGDIGAITRLEKVHSGSTLCSPKSIIKYDLIKYPSPVIYKAIVLTNKNDEAKLGGSLAKICLEDPTVEVKRNNETKQLLVGGVSESHINYVIEKLKNLYKIEVTFEPLKIVYKESIKSTYEADGRYIKQSGGSGFYGVVKMRFEPAPENCFAEEIFGGAVPKNYFPAVEKGFFEACNEGLLAGFPVVGVKGVLTDGKYHPVDSNEMAFKMAAVLAFKEAYLKCNPIILEPIMRIKVVVNNQYTGDVLSDLNTRRARIQNMDEVNGEQVIEALIPEAEIVDYVTNLKSITQASGTFSREFECYEQIPEFLKEKVIKENKLN